MSSTNPKTYESAPSRRVAFLGLGVMGLPMAGHLALAGHDVTVYNRSAAKAQAWVAEFKGKAAATPREAASAADIVFCCVGNDDDLRSVTLGADGAFAGMKPGAIFVDHTTASADVARELGAVAKEKGLRFLDAPVSGGQAGAQNGALTVLIGCDKAVYERAVHGPMLALLDELTDYGPFHVFRPYRDVRFSKDKTPYKDHMGAYGESEGGAGHYVHFSVTGFYVGSGYYDMRPDQLERFRTAVDSPATGDELVRLCEQATAAGLRPGAMSELKTAPRGYAKDHPRVELLRRKGLITGKELPLAKWVHTKQVVGKVRAVWDAGAAVNAWLDAHVGPSTLPPDDAR